MNLLFRKFIIKLALSYVREPVASYYEEIKWDNDDSNALNDYLKSDSGKKFEKMMTWNSNKVLGRVTRAQKEELDDIRAESKAWRALGQMLTMLRVPKKDIKDLRLTEKRSEEMFAKMVNNSSRINTNAIYQRN